MKEKKFCVLLWPELPADVARPDAELRQLHYPQPHVVGQGPSVDEDSAELVDLPVRVDMRRLWTNQKLISLDFLSSRCWLLGPFGVAGTVWWSHLTQITFQAKSLQDLQLWYLNFSTSVMNKEIFNFSNIMTWNSLNNFLFWISLRNNQRKIEILYPSKVTSRSRAGAEV